MPPFLFGIAIVFDLTNQASFANVKPWIREIERHGAPKNVPKIIIGTKSDLEKTVASDVVQVKFLYELHLLTNCIEIC